MGNMKRLVQKFLLFACLLTLVSPVFAEEISSFTSDITINQNGTVNVIETIRYDFGDSERHGIFRTIPLIKTNAEGKRFWLNIDTGNVSNETGNSYRVSKSTEDNSLKLKIGDPDKTITGVHTYVIPYTVGGGITYFSDHDELYWNVTGTEWDVPIGNVVAAAVRLPQNFDANDVRLACYVGAAGSTEDDCISVYANGIATFMARSLVPNENLTVVVSFPRDVVAVLEPAPVISFWETLWGKLTIVGIALLMFLWYLVLPIKIIVDWFKRGRDPKAPMGVTSAWFSAPKTDKGIELTPAETGTLVDERADIADIVATIVDLARRGYLTIKETKKGEFSLEKAKEFTDDRALADFEHTLLSGLFAKGKTFTTKQGSLVTIIATVQKELYVRVVNAGLFDKNPHAVRERYTILGVLGFITANIPLAFVSFIFGHAMPRKTLHGAQTANVGRSLKNFLTSQKRYLKFQADKQLLFEKLLPFAIAFGVEEVWAARFRDITLKPPEWYQGPVGTRFSSTHFTHSLHSSFASGISRSATPTSSSSGFSSGFSGGSSGGGGGGGGGGSW